MRVWMLIVFLFAACARPQSNQETNQKLDDIMKRLGTLEAQQNRAEGRLADLSDAVASLIEQHRQLVAKIDRIPAEIALLVAARTTPSATPSRARPDPAKVYSIPIDGDPVKGGSKKSLVTIVIAAEFACPHCLKIREPLADVLARYPDDVRLVFKHFVVHPQVAMLPALASCAAHQQGRFWDMEALIYATAWPNGYDHGLDRTKTERPVLVDHAEALKLDVDRFQRDLDSDACKKDVSGDQAAMQQVGVSGTPTVYVNGRVFTGSRTVEGFSIVIDEELKKARAYVKEKKIKPEKYYQQVVVDGGLKRLE